MRNLVIPVSAAQTKTPDLILKGIYRSVPVLYQFSSTYVLISEISRLHSIFDCNRPERKWELKVRSLDKYNVTP